MNQVAILPTQIQRHVLLTTGGEHVCAVESPLSTDCGTTTTTTVVCAPSEYVHREKTNLFEHRGSYTTPTKKSCTNTHRVYAHWCSEAHKRTSHRQFKACCTPEGRTTRIKPPRRQATMIDSQLMAAPACWQEGVYRKG